MNLYKILVINPGGANLNYNIYAYSFSVQDGVYRFYDKGKQVIYSFPCNLSIIENIEKNVEKK